MSGGELCTTCQSLLFLTWTSCLWLSWRNVFTCRTGLCFSFGRGLSLPTLGVFTFIQYLLARFWIRADLINSSFPLPFPSGDAPVAPGCSLLSAQPPVLLVVPSQLCRPFPGVCAGQRVWNSQIPAPPGPGTPCLYPQSRLPHITPWLVGFFFLNKEQIWGLIYKSWVFPSPGTPKTSKAFIFSICL